MTIAEQVRALCVRAINDSGQTFADMGLPDVARAFKAQADTLLLLDLSQIEPKEDVRDTLESLHKYQRALETGDPDRQPTEGSDIALVKRVYNLIKSLSAQLAERNKQFDDLAALSTKAHEWRQRAEKAESQLAEVQKDAERYRALFQTPTSVNMPVLRPPFYQDPKGLMGYSNKEGADKAIDAAIDKATASDAHPCNHNE